MIAGKERDFCRRRIGGKRRKHGNTGELQRVDALSERCLKRSLPARLDAKPRMQPREALKAVPFQPGLDLGLALKALLQLAKRRQTRVDSRKRRLGLTQRLLGRRPRGV